MHITTRCSITVECDEIVAFNEGDRIVQYDGVKSSKIIRSGVVKIVDPNSKFANKVVIEWDDNTTVAFKDFSETATLNKFVQQLGFERTHGDIQKGLATVAKIYK